MCFISMVFSILFFCLLRHIVMLSLSGVVGQGKTNCCLWELEMLLLACREHGIKLSVSICDFKGIDFKFLEGYPLYYSAEECYIGIADYYQKFTELRKKGQTSPNHRYLLIFDELASAVSYLKTKEKNKSKQTSTELLTSTQLIGINAELLMMGRSCGGGFGVWTCTQYGTSDLFGGARLNYMITISLGRQNKEQVNMLFSGEDIPKNRIYKPGEGLLLADGHILTEVKYPMLDMEKCERFIRGLLFENIS